MVGFMLIGGEQATPPVGGVTLSVNLGIFLKIRSLRIVPKEIHVSSMYYRQLPQSSISFKFPNSGEAIALHLITYWGNAALELGQMQLILILKL